MTPEQFIIWFDGMLTGNHGAQPSEKQWEAIVSRMTEVTKPKFILNTQRMSCEDLARGIQEGDVYDRLAKNGTIPGRMEFVAHNEVPKVKTYGPVVIPGVSQ